MKSAAFLFLFAIVFQFCTLLTGLYTLVFSEEKLLGLILTAISFCIFIYTYFILIRLIYKISKMLDGIK